MKKIINILFLIVALSLLTNTVLAATPGKQVTISLVNQDPDPALTGDVVEIRVGIENLGSIKVDDFKLELVPEYPFELLPGEEAVQDIGTLTAYQAGYNMKIVKYKLRVNKDATAGQYGLRFLGTEGGVQRFDKTLNIDIRSREAAEIIYIDKVELLPGKITPMTFTINNVGSAPLKDLTFSWENGDGVILPVGSDDTRYVKYIDIGGKEELVYNVIASLNAEPDLYKLNLKLTYDDPDSDEEKAINTIAGVYIGGETDFDIAYSGSSKGETSFSIANIGSVPANSVTVSIPEQESWRVSGSDSVIIGNLNNGDYTIASFNIQQSSGMQGMSAEDRQKMRESGGTMPISRDVSETVIIEVSYTDTRGLRKIFTKEVNVDLSALRTSTTTENGMQQMNGFPKRRQSTGDKILSYTLWVGLIILILVALVFSTRFYRKKKSQNSDYSLRSIPKDVFRAIKKNFNKKVQK